MSYNQDMGYQQYYGGVIWTNHALGRLSDRGLTQKMAWEVFHSPDKSFSGKQEGSIEYIKRFDSSKVTIIAKQNEKKEWIILSGWIDPPMPGSLDFKKKEQYKKYQKASFWGKFWLTFKGQLGL